MNTFLPKGVFIAPALLTALLAASPAKAASSAVAPVPAAMNASSESVLAAAASPSAFASSAHAAWLAETTSAPVVVSVPLSTPVAFSSSSSTAERQENTPVENIAENAIPEAPQPVRVYASAFMFQASNTGTAPKYSMDIPSGWTAQHLSAGDKVVLGIRNLANVESLAGTAISAGYAHLTNGQPNYGTDGDAFAQRFGAGVARSASQDIFTNSVLAPILHQDPRYYIEGPQFGFFHRVLYAATRPIIGRTDGGHTTVNAALLIGYAGAAALTPTYYPSSNRNFRDVASTYGSSIGGAAIGFAVSEFSDQLLKAIHLKK